MKRMLRETEMNMANGLKVLSLALAGAAVIMAGGAYAAVTNEVTVCPDAKPIRDVSESNCAPIIWKLIWSDEFDYQGLPDKTKWDYEEGFVRNNERQYYTRERLENARVEAGLLILECRKEHFTPEKHAPVECTAASLITLNKASWQYGRIEVRAKLPQGKGVWPAIWMLGTNISRVGWPACGEIDIMEFVGKEPGTIYGTLHYAIDGKHRYDGGKIKTAKPYDDFHIYAIEWKPDRIDVFFDSNKYHTVLIDKAGKGEDNPFRKPHYLLINFAVGGSWGGPIDETIFPQKFFIDYVRLYRETGGQQGAPADAEKLRR